MIPVSGSCLECQPQCSATFSCQCQRDTWNGVYDLHSFRLVSKESSGSVWRGTISYWDTLSLLCYANATEVEVVTASVWRSSVWRLLRHFVHPSECSSDSLMGIVPTSGSPNLNQVWRGAWVAHPVKSSTHDISSAHGLVIGGTEPRVGLCTDGGSLLKIPSLSAIPSLSFSLPTSSIKK